jgi:hypothetical protein
MLFSRDDLLKCLGLEGYDRFIKEVRRRIDEDGIYKSPTKKDHVLVELKWGIRNG